MDRRGFLKTMLGAGAAGATAALPSFLGASTPGRPIVAMVAAALALFWAPMLRAAGSFETGVAPGVGGSWTTVNLANAYTTPVVVCTANYDHNTSAIAVRVRNAAANSFQVRLQSPSDWAIVADNVHYMVVEEGAWRFPDGRLIEARRVLSDGLTNNATSWTITNAYMETYAYANVLTAPVVLGQVMTANDPKWSVFWSCLPTDRKTAPNASGRLVGKHVAEDVVLTRANETLGVIVIDGGKGTLNGAAYETSCGARLVKGVENNPPFSYNLSFASTPAVAIATMAGQNGGDGAWVHLFGPNPLTPSAIRLVADEDEIKDLERSHGSAEAVHFFVMQSPVSAQLESAAPPPAWPYATGFEPPSYAAGCLHDQEGWASTNNAYVRDASALSGQQSIELSSMSAVRRTFESTTQSAAWVEMTCAATPSDAYPDLSIAPPATCGLFFHTTAGLVCLDGDGAGGGAWRVTGVPVNERTRLSLRQDFANHKWDVFVNGNRLVANLSFKDNLDLISGVECQSGENGSMLLDDLRAGYTSPTVPLYELTPVALDFGRVRVGDGRAKPLSITNLGYAPQSFAGVMRPASSTPFHVSSGLPLVNLPPAGAGAATVGFDPVTTGGFTASLDVVAQENALVATFSVLLAGQGIVVNSAADVGLWQRY